MAKRVDIRLKLSSNAKAVIDRQVRLGRFPDASAYVEDAIMRSRGITPVANLAGIEEAAADGIGSGKPTPMTKKDWTGIRAEVRRRAAARSSQPRKRSA